MLEKPFLIFSPLESGLPFCAVQKCDTKKITADKFEVAFI